MVTREDVNGFLNEFKMKMDIWDIIFLDTRPKNIQTLADLEITSFKRKAIVKELTVQDFSEGPIDEVVFMGTPMWVGYLGKKLRIKKYTSKFQWGLQVNKHFVFHFILPNFP